MNVNEISKRLAIVFLKGQPVPLPSVDTEALAALDERLTDAIKSLVALRSAVRAGQNGTWTPEEMAEHVAESCLHNGNLANFYEAEVAGVMRNGRRS